MKLWDSIDALLRSPFRPDLIRGWDLSRTFRANTKAIDIDIERNEALIQSFKLRPSTLQMTAFGQEEDQWNSETSGFESVTAMQAWCNEAAQKEPSLFRHLLVPFEEGQVVRFKDKLTDVQWKSIGELSSSEKKALRWDYHQWRARVSEYIDSERRPIGFAVPGSNGPTNSAPFEPAHVKLFAGTRENGDEVWSIVWGMNLDNEKENFLPSYASRGSATASGIEGGQDSVRDKGSFGDRFRTPINEPARERLRRPLQCLGADLSTCK